MNSLYCPRLRTFVRLLLLSAFLVLGITPAFAHYSPRLGRWLSRDPIGEEGGFNLYAYCGNDPVNRHDPTGLKWVEGPVVKRYWHVAGHGSLYLTQRERYWVEEAATPENLLMSLLTGLETGMGQWGSQQQEAFTALMGQLQRDPAALLQQMEIDGPEDVLGLIGQAATSAVTDPIDAARNLTGVLQQANSDWNNPGRGPNYAVHHASMGGGPMVGAAVLGYIFHKAGVGRGLQKFPDWTPGDPITKLTTEGAYPSWSTIRSRYWQNRVSVDGTAFGAANRAIMGRGFAPKGRVLVRDRETGRVYERLVEKELHHARGNRGVPGFDSPLDLREVWPWEHEALLPPGRKLDYDFLGFK